MRWLIVTTDEDRSRDYFSWADSVRYTDAIGMLHGEYDVIYFRDPFNTGEYDVEYIKSTLVHIKQQYPEAVYIDAVTRYEDLLFEDKWRQYQLVGEFMPSTELFDTKSKFRAGSTIVKKRISARARDIIQTNEQLVDIALEEYIVQEKIDIDAEYRVYTIGNRVLPFMTQKSSKTLDTKVKVLGVTKIDDAVAQFVQKIQAKLEDLDLLGYDIARTPTGLALIEVNRSPQFKRYNELTYTNVADELRTYIEDKITEESAQWKNVEEKSS